MFVLTCPSCRHQVQVRYARMGATATCVACHKLFKVNEDTAEGSIAYKTAAEAASEAALVASVNDEDDAEVPAVLDGPVAVLEKPTTAVRTRPRVAKGARPAVSPPRTSKRVPLASLLRKLRNGLPVILAFVTAAVLGLYGVLTVNARAQLRAQVADAAPARSEPVVVPEVIDSPPPVVLGGGDEALSSDPPPNAPPAVAARVLPRAQVAAVTESYWSKLDPPAPPMTMLHLNTGVKGEAYLERDRNGGDAVVRGTYSLTTGRVHRNSLLHVRMINPAGLSYAETKRQLPILTGKQNIEVAVPVPAEWLGQMGTALVEITPGEEVPEAVPLESMQWRYSVLSASGQLKVVTLALRNPMDVPVRDPRFALDLLDERGAVVGSWRGKVDATIEPGKSIDIEAYISTPADVPSERLVLRSYGLPVPEMPEP